jgi:ferredoxin
MFQPQEQRAAAATTVRRPRWTCRRDGALPGVRALLRPACDPCAVAPVKCFSHPDGFAVRSLRLSSRQKPGAKTYTVTVHGREAGVVHTLQVPEDRYIWWAMEDAGFDLPASCRNGCCTTCAVRVKSGTVQQDEALGLLRQMRDKKYALLCVSYPRSDVVCELQDEDEVYLQQFGDSFESGGVEWGGVMADLEEE